MLKWWMQLWTLMLPLFVLDKSCLEMWFPAKWLVVTPLRVLYFPITIALYTGTAGVFGLVTSFWYTFSGEGEWGDHL